MKSWAYAFLALPIGIAVGIGCAEAPVDDPLYGIMKTEPEDDAGKDKSIKLPETEADDDDDKPSSTSSSSSTSGAPAKDDAGAPPKDAGPPPPPPGPDPCAKNTCSGVKDIGALSGDTGSPSRTITGATGRWLTLTLEENETGLFASGRKLRLKATLTSPAGHNFDLFIYQPGAAKQCTAIEKASESVTDPDIASISFGEDDGGGGNGFSDTSIVTVEVREIGGTAGTCDPTALWTLKLEGNK